MTIPLNSAALQLTTKALDAPDTTLVVATVDQNGAAIVIRLRDNSPAHLVRIAVRLLEQADDALCRRRMTTADMELSDRINASLCDLPSFDADDAEEEGNADAS